MGIARVHERSATNENRSIRVTLVSLGGHDQIGPFQAHSHFAKSQTCDNRVTNVKQKKSSRKKSCIRTIIETQSNQNKGEPIKMKQLRTSFTIISLFALLALTAGCSTTSGTQNKESMLVASGFKVITPKTAAQQQKLQQIPPGHVAMVNRNGRTYYVFPDAAHNQAYVGGPKEYQAYQQLRLANNIAQENIETAQMYQDAAMQWGAWGGWGAGWGPMGLGVGVGRFR
jgi:hypothetical protein